MSDLISKGLLIEHLDACLAESDGHTPLTGAVLMAVRCAVEQMPTVDAVEVVHGHWDEMADCSVCGMPAPTDDRIDYINICELNYCPYCGAKMDEEEE